MIRLRDIGVHRPGESSGRFAAHTHDEADPLADTQPIPVITAPPRITKPKPWRAYAQPTEVDFEIARAQDRLASTAVRGETAIPAAQRQEFRIAGLARRQAQYWQFQRAFDDGARHPMDHFFDTAWEGGNAGHRMLTRERAEADLEHAQRTLEERPDDDAAATTVTHMREALRTRGRSWFPSIRTALTELQSIDPDSR